MTPPPPVFGRAVRHVHLLGAGGMGMAPLGLYLRERGFTVSAEDDAWNPATRELLERAGIELTKLRGCPAATELVVHSPAVDASHPSRSDAVARGIPVVRRGEMLAESTRDRRVVAVVGSHGKTTTTAMLVTALRNAEFECGWVLGGLFNGNALPPARDAADWMILEVDESDGTIGRFAPAVTLAVNLDWDHADHYAQPGELEQEFAALFTRTTGAIFLNSGCEASLRLATRANQKAAVYRFGATGDFTFAATEQSDGMQLQLGGRFSGTEARVRVIGEFNAVNACAALAVAQHLGAKTGPDALAEFAGVQRRQTVLHASSRATIYEDYAHHPAEIRALLQRLRRGPGRLVVVFQPHRYTRTAQFKSDFAAALANSDQLFLLDVYAASESPVPGGATEDLLAECRRVGAKEVTYFPSDRAATEAALRAALQTGDTVAFVGAGDVGEFGREFSASFAAEEVPADRWTDFVQRVRPRLSNVTKFTEHERLGPKTTMRIGGPARVYTEPADEQELSSLLSAAHEDGLPVFMLGRGSNLIVPDEGVDGLVISLAHPHWQEFVPQPDGRIWVGAGLRLKNLCGLAVKAGLGGFEFMEGIPATVGGALRMNAGAMGGWTFDVVEEVHVMSLAGVKRVLKKSEMHYDYRHCADLEAAVALGAFLRPRPSAGSAEIKNQIETYQRKRQESQPREPSAGCIFKNPPGTSAGRVIDECGLKGRRVGDAEVSAVHANFIINRGNATSADVLELVRHVRAQVKSLRGIELQPEVMLFGRNWRDVL